MSLSVVPTENTGLEPANPRFSPEPRLRKSAFQGKTGSRRPEPDSSQEPQLRKLAFQTFRRENGFWRQIPRSSKSVELRKTRARSKTGDCGREVDSSGSAQLRKSPIRRRNHFDGSDPGIAVELQLRVAKALVRGLTIRETAS